MSPHLHPLFKKLNAKCARSAHVKDAKKHKVIHFNVAWIAPYKVDINEHRLTVKYPEEATPPCGKRALKRPRASGTAQKSNTGWVIWQRPPRYPGEVFGTVVGPQQVPRSRPVHLPGNVPESYEGGKSVNSRKTRGRNRTRVCVGGRVLLLHMAQVEGVKRIHAIVRNSLENTERVKPTALEILSHRASAASDDRAATFKLFH